MPVKVNLVCKSLIFFPFESVKLYVPKFTAQKVSDTVLLKRFVFAKHKKFTFFSSCYIITFCEKLY